MASILVIIGTIYYNQFKCIYLKRQKFFIKNLLHFQNLHNIWNIFKENEPHSLSISEIIYSKKCGYLNP